MGKLSKDKRDIYYRKAKEDGYRARSAYKLLQLDDRFSFIEGSQRIVDLCAAPGSWSQVVSNRCKGAKVVSVDLQEMAPIPGVHILQGDITSEATAKQILGYFENEKADLVICDGAPDVTGMHDLDEYIQVQLLLAALGITTCLLAEGGTFVAKVFRGENTDVLYSKMRVFFDDVRCCKPKSSRNSSTEAFLVCRGFHLPDGCGSLVDFTKYMESKSENLDPQLVPFVACGDLDGLDADRNYTLADDHMYVEPVQMPIHAPYEGALQQKRGQTAQPFPVATES